VTGPKLIRDRIPQIAADRGDTMTIRVAASGEMVDLLRAKLAEEVAEYLGSSDPAELADVLEVLHALARMHGFAPSWLEQRRALKAEQRGGFAAGIVWAGDDDD
jgi:predicted house-cleaning noncanonical NTP pyrophosphatase (MazG superfamily)